MGNTKSKKNDTKKKIQNNRNDDPVLDASMVVKEYNTNKDDDDDSDISLTDIASFTTTHEDREKSSHLFDHLKNVFHHSFHHQEFYSKHSMELHLDKDELHKEENPNLHVLKDHRDASGNYDVMHAVSHMLVDEHDNLRKSCNFLTENIHTESHMFSLDDMVECKNKETDSWQMGHVISINPLKIRIKANNLFRRYEEREFKFIRLKLDKSKRKISKNAALKPKKKEMSWGTFLDFYHHEYSTMRAEMDHLKDLVDHAPGVFCVGQQVFCKWKQTEKEWTHGTVQSVNPLKIRYGLFSRVEEFPIVATDKQLYHYEHIHRDVHLGDIMKFYAVSCILFVALESSYQIITYILCILAMLLLHEVQYIERILVIPLFVLEDSGIRVSCGGVFDISLKYIIPGPGCVCCIYLILLRADWDYIREEIKNNGIYFLQKYSKHIKKFSKLILKRVWIRKYIQKSKIELYTLYVARQWGKKIAKFIFVDTGNIIKNPVILKNHLPDVIYSEKDHFFILKYFF